MYEMRIWCGLVPTYMQYLVVLDVCGYVRNADLVFSNHIQLFVLDACGYV